MSDTIVPPSPCPYCGRTMDAATCVNGDRGPGPGDYSVCLYCRETLVYKNDLTTRKITDQEERALPDEVRFSLFQAKLFATQFNKKETEG